MKPRDIDKLIASQVLGYEVTDNYIVREGRRSGIPSYSEEIKYAWQVVEKMKNDHEFWFELTTDSAFSLDYRCRFQLDEVDIEVINPSPSLAICKAALKVIEEQNKN
ncbi:hypothetical protein COO03_05010 [Bacillus sp. AFS098217]|uniref:BC1872 family protein n=1 Tax=Bacillus sp. AFS098217 TaxID=2033868 RepID=UPI000BEBB430|nr:hypothetical protein [Bacillus sp. AFS098217]PEB54602.1 hypothetical protein COO03_05010 [Bacillus sp. AFS098217]